MHKKVIWDILIIRGQITQMTSFRDRLRDGTRDWVMVTLDGTGPDPSRDRSWSRKHTLRQNECRGSRGFLGTTPRDWAWRDRTTELNFSVGTGHDTVFPCFLVAIPNNAAPNNNNNNITTTDCSEQFLRQMVLSNHTVVNFYIGPGTVTIMYIYCSPSLRCMKNSNRNYGSYYVYTYMYVWHTVCTYAGAVLK